MNKVRVRGIIIEGKQIVLIYRVKKDRQYYVFPGGGVERGEDYEQTLRRECLEELGINVEVKNQVYKFIERDGSTQIFYNCIITKGILGTGRGTEFTSSNKSKGDYFPKKMDLESISKLPIFPVEIKNSLFGDMIKYKDINKIPCRVIYEQ